MRKGCLVFIFPPNLGLSFLLYSTHELGSPELPTALEGQMRSWRNSLQYFYCHDENTNLHKMPFSKIILALLHVKYLPLPYVLILFMTAHSICILGSG